MDKLKKPSHSYSPIRTGYKYFSVLKAEGSFLVSLVNHKTFENSMCLFSCQHIPASVLLGWLGKNCPVTWNVSSEGVLDLSCCEQVRKWFRSGLNHGNLQSRIGMNIQHLLKIQNTTVAPSLNGEKNIISVEIWEQHLAHLCKDCESHMTTEFLGVKSCCTHNMCSKLQELFMK